MPTIFVMKPLIALAIVLIALAGVAVAASTADTAAAPPSGSAATTYDDPFAYCAAVGTIDAADSRYVGPQNTPAMVKGYADAAGLSADAPFRTMPGAIQWRCGEGRLLVCFVGANIPCGTKADLSTTPTAAMVTYCATADEQQAKGLPAVVTGRATIYGWDCQNGQPHIASVLNQPDAQGYLARFWYAISP